jgi:hypothetical protein
LIWEMLPRVKMGMVAEGARVRERGRRRGEEAMGGEAAIAAAAIASPEMADDALRFGGESRRASEPVVDSMKEVR